MGLVYLLFFTGLVLPALVLLVSIPTIIRTKPQSHLDRSGYVIGIVVLAGVQLILGPYFSQTIAPFMAYFAACWLLTLGYSRWLALPTLLPSVTAMALTASFFGWIGTGDGRLPNHEHWSRAPHWGTFTVGAVWATLFVGLPHRKKARASANTTRRS